MFSVKLDYLLNLSLGYNTTPSSFASKVLQQGCPFHLIFLFYTLKFFYYFFHTTVQLHLLKGFKNRWWLWNILCVLYGWLFTDGLCYFKRCYLSLSYTKCLPTYYGQSINFIKSHILFSLGTDHAIHRYIIDLLHISKKMNGLVIFRSPFVCLFEPLFFNFFLIKFQIKLQLRNGKFYLLGPCDLTSVGVICSLFDTSFYVYSS